MTEVRFEFAQLLKLHAPTGFDPSVPPPALIDPHIRAP
jgi:hypothetical protein